MFDWDVCCAYARPQWFISLIDDMYDNKFSFQDNIGDDSDKRARQARIRSFWTLLGMFIIDIAPIPTTPIIAFFIILSWPRWFVRIVGEVYGKDIKA
jgi:hypothetical protein